MQEILDHKSSRTTEFYTYEAPEVCRTSKAPLMIWILIKEMAYLIKDDKTTTCPKVSTACGSFVISIYKLGPIIMRRLKLWLIEKSSVQTYTITIVLALTIASRYFIDQQIRKTQDFYSPIIYSLVILWVYYSLFFRVILDEDVNERIILRRRFDEPKELFGKFIKLSVLIFFGYGTYFILGRLGVLISLSIITITGLFCIFMIAKNTWKEKSSHKDFMETLGQFAIMAGIVGYIYFIPWKSSYSYEFGVKEIGNYFEKDTYETKYIVEVSRVDGGNTYKLPADILVSDDFSEYESYDTETGVGAYSYETTETSEIRYAKIKKVYFNNRETLFFKDCLVSIDNSYDCTCYDQDGEEWQIEMTNEKVK